jgi:hypothetical protein
MALERIPVPRTRMYLYRALWGSNRYLNYCSLTRHFLLSTADAAVVSAPELFTRNFARIFVFPKGDKHWVPKFSIAGPFGEFDLADEDWGYPIHFLHH